MRFKEAAQILAEEGYPVSNWEVGQVAELPIMFHYGRADLAVAFYGCKITPNEIEKIVFETEALAPIVELFALVTSEDERSNKMLTVALELRPGAVAPSDCEALRVDMFERLAAANQDYRESRRMIPVGLEPSVAFFAHRTGPFEGKDIRLKSKYIQEAGKKS
jgi:phenylacetate-CoA ligase